MFIYTSTDFPSPRTCPTDHGRPRYAPGATAVRVAYARPHPLGPGFVSEKILVYKTTNLKIHFAQNYEMDLEIVMCPYILSYNY